MFRKSLARYYIGWFFDCHESAIHCIERGLHDRAEQYLGLAGRYLTIIMENLEAIDFFSVGDNAFKLDSALPEKFRGYE